MTTTQPFDVLAIGRSGVDIYPLQIGVGLEHVESFGKFLGGSAANVAVAAARLGNRTALISGVGADPFGKFVSAELAELGVDNRFVLTHDEYPTPVTFCEIFPPDNFPLYFYRRPSAPDLQIRPDEIDVDAVRSAGLYWSTVTGLSEEPSRSAHFAAWEARDERLRVGAPPARRGGGEPTSGGRASLTILDLDYRPMFWESPAAATDQVQRALQHVTVAVGNREECEIAVGESNPHSVPPTRCWTWVSSWPSSSRVHAGVLGKTRHSHVNVAPNDVDVVNGLGAGDAFGGSLCHGLLHGWPLEKTLRYANAAGAIVASRLECSTAMPTAARSRRPGRSDRSGGRQCLMQCAGTTPRSPTCVRPTRQAVERAWQTRATRPAVRGNGRLMIVAADHPARGALGVGDRGPPR